MVTGLDLFRERFAAYADSYVLIGGAACYIHEEMSAQVPRATKDLDVVLVVEALSADFVREFWQFVREAGYTRRQRGADKHECYRFLQPQDKRYPKQIELFARAIGVLNIPEDAHLEPIPAGDELSSLSAILMNEAYYHYTIAHSRLVEGVHVANIEALICLKAKAYVDLCARKAQGDHVDQDDIEKHKKDVFRLAPMLTRDARYELPIEMQEDMRLFFGAIETELPNVDFLRNAGLGSQKVEELLAVLKRAYLGE